MTSLPTAPLTGRLLALTLLTEDDLPELAPLLDDPEVYAHGYVMHRRPASLDDGIALGRERFLGSPPDGRGGGRTAYAVRLRVDSPLGAAGTLVGTSSLGEADLDTESIHLGWTLYGSRWWAGAVNPACKLLLLQHCFEDCGYGRVKIQTDLLNTRSQAAIAKLGAVREGVLRRAVRREDGSWRDTVVFSVLVEEWPMVKAGLLARVGG